MIFNFPIGNEKLIILGVPIIKHINVFADLVLLCC